VNPLPAGYEDDEREPGLSARHQGPQH
jgi:hypothetical protein